MQRLIYGLVGVAALSALALVVELVRRNVAPPAAAVPAPRVCPDARRPPAALLPELSAAPLVLSAAHATVTIDGQPAPAALTEGLHLVEAQEAGASPASVKLQVSAFAPVLLDARAVAGSVVVTVLGARCASCPHAETDVDLQYRRGGIGDERGVARALSQADWPLAAQQIRAIPTADFTGPRAAHLRAALFGLAGRPSLARAELALLPQTDPLHAALRAWAKTDANTTARQLETATARWNAVTERLQRLTERFASDAPEAITALTTSIGALAPRVIEAQAKGQTIELESRLEEATLALARTMSALRAQRPTDCEWQARITAAE